LSTSFTVVLPSKTLPIPSYRFVMSSGVETSHAI
jgi:hypothetical protein